MPKLSTAVANLLGKPEDYVEIALVPVPNMSFGGSTEACAFVELKSLGLKAEQGKELSAALAALLKDSLGLAPERVYIQMSDHPRELWGWNSSTFG
jgi:phenylpyruvate tautomerase